MRCLRRLPLPFAFLASLVLISPSCGGVPTSEPAGPAVVASPPAKAAAPVALPNVDGSLKFLAFGDFGTGEASQHQLARQMTDLHLRFKYELVILLGDNIYGTQNARNMRLKFEIPYKPLLDAGVKFRASLGNHDSRSQINYDKFGMEGQRYYSFKAPKQNVRFFVIESDSPISAQLEWLEKELKSATDEWKIAYFHHPLYSSARGHGSTENLRRVLEPLFVRYNVSVVMSGHDHTYERTKPQQGVVYFVAGSAGKLRRGDLNRRSPFFEAGYDQDLAFMACEIDGDNMFFNAISRTGAVVDSGIVIRRKATTP
jgi:3',5'-cyclic AMP phosphodiesterase CpdA